LTRGCATRASSPGVGTVDDIAEAIVAHLADTWPGLNHDLGLDPASPARGVQVRARALAELADLYPLGAILGHRLTDIIERGPLDLLVDDRPPGRLLTACYGSPVIEARRGLARQQARPG
jgi:hypothetical protein